MTRIVGKGRITRILKPKTESPQSPSLEQILKRELDLAYKSAVLIRKTYLKMRNAIQNVQLREIFESQLSCMDEEVSRLETIFERWERVPDPKVKCSATNVLLQQIKKITKIYEPGVTRDIFLVIYCQKTEYLGVSAYRIIGELCETIGFYKIGEMLDNSLADKENICRELIEVVRKLNDEAAKSHFSSDLPQGSLQLK